MRNKAARIHMRQVRLRRLPLWITLVRCHEDAYRCGAIRRLSGGNGAPDAALHAAAGA